MTQIWPNVEKFASDGKEFIKIVKKPLRIILARIHKYLWL